MKFCPVCQNMLYSIDDDTDNKAIMSCRKCEYKEAISRDNPIIYEHNLRDVATSVAVNPYLKFDVTLPRFEMTCPNSDCPSRQKGKSEIVGVKIDRTNLIWMYQCTTCDITWKQNGSAS